MRPLQLIALLMSSAAAAPVLAQGCSGTPLDRAQLTTIFGGGNKLVCGRAVKPGYPGNASDLWQEEHLGGPANGDLWDYKLGPGHAVDPRKKVGVWFISRGATPLLVHEYSSTVQFEWLVFGPTSNTPGTSVYSFCTNTSAPVEQARAFVRNTGSACSSYP
jgi:hypothetical protein